MTVTTVDPRAALVVIDLQAGIVNLPTVPATGPEVLSRTISLASAFRERDLPDVLVRVTGLADGTDAVGGRTDAGPRPGETGTTAEILSLLDKTYG